jgi:hypothetical protein
MITIKTTTTHTLAAALTAALVLAFVPLTSDAQRPAANGERQLAGAFCSGLSDREAEIGERLGNLRGSGERQGEREARRAERLANFEERRDTKDADRTALYERLRAAADTDDESAAVDEFESTVEALVDERRAAVDAAVEAFEDAIAALAAERQAAVESQSAELANLVAAIFDEAEAACDAGDSPGEVRQAFTAGMQSLREEARAKRGQYGDYRSEIEAARATRQAAMEAAALTFRAGMDAAKADLRAAFGN